MRATVGGKLDPQRAARANMAFVSELRKSQAAFDLLRECHDPNPLCASAQRPVLKGRISSRCAGVFRWSRQTICRELQKKMWRWPTVGCQGQRDFEDTALAQPIGRPLLPLRTKALLTAEPQRDLPSSF